jgi:peptidoglycan/LPS O-acetylase OafA/YrhL
LILRLHRRVGVPPSFGRRLHGVEGLRAVAACSVLVYHSWAVASPDAKLGPLVRVLPDLQFGVTLFFTLSGFLLYRPFVSSVLRSEQLPSFSTYLRNRALRILPAYWVVLLVAGLGLQTVLVRHGSDLGPDRLFDPGLMLGTALFVQNYAPSSVGSGIGPAWSLAVEAVYYLALPLLALLAFVLARRASSRGGRRLAALAPPALMLGIGLLGKAVAAWAVPPVSAFNGWNNDWHSVIERSFWCQADLFAFGMALAVLRVDSEDGLLRLPRVWRQGAAACVLVSYLITAKLTYQAEQLSYSFTNTLMALACGLLLALVVLPARHDGKQPALVRLLETRPFVALGLISYSIFLWHGPLIRWLKVHDLTVGGSFGFVVNTLVLALLTFVLSAITYRFVEIPALRRKRRTRRVADPVPSLTQEQAAAAQ